MKNKIATKIQSKLRAIKIEGINREINIKSLTNQNKFSEEITGMTLK